MKQIRKTLYCYLSDNLWFSKLENGFRYAQSLNDRSDLTNYTKYL